MEYHFITKGWLKLAYLQCRHEYCHRESQILDESPFIGIFLLWKCVSRWMLMCYVYKYVCTRMRVCMCVYRSQDNHWFHSSDPSIHPSVRLSVCPSFLRPLKQCCSFREKTLGVWLPPLSQHQGLEVCATKPRFFYVDSWNQTKFPRLGLQGKYFGNWIMPPPLHTPYFSNNV